MARWVDQWRPRSWLDAFGYLVELAGVLVFTWNVVLMFRATNGGSDTWPWSALISAGAFALSFVGYAIRRIARKEPVFRKS